ncbi:hypothetical protein F383_10988 [Gossypium arboreum]|uniref:Uncharacterized protein n=1 Tax=Gossypium arboreum TaxID=29729 RepID=A0A0B0PSN3_GOSAR|nr:hypothetical protein F383_10988 [Gossypium arboreum]
MCSTNSKQNHVARI